MSDADEAELPEWASTAFWGLVLVFNIAIFLTAVGAMVLYFEDDWVLGGIMLAIGAVAWLVGFGGYYLIQRKLPE